MKPDVTTQTCHYRYGDEWQAPRARVNEPSATAGSPPEPAVGVPRAEVTALRGERDHDAPVDVDGLAHVASVRFLELAALRLGGGLSVTLRVSQRGRSARR
jgi:hypothetical protein